MTTLTIRQVDDSIKDKLRAISKSNGRSVESEVRLLIANYVAHEYPRSVSQKYGLGTELVALFNGAGETLELPSRSELPRKIGLE
jgi:plasmid stability protein